MPFDPLSAAVTFVTSRVVPIVERWRRVRVRVHLAYVEGDANEKVFVNVTNLSSRDVEVIRVWFATEPPVEVVNPARPLPRRLRPDESWETWCDLRSFADRNVARLARVRLSSGKTAKSRARGDVGPRGVIPGA